MADLLRQSILGLADAENREVDANRYISSSIENMKKKEARDNNARNAFSRANPLNPMAGMWGIKAIGNVLKNAFFPWKDEQWYDTASPVERVFDMFKPESYSEFDKQWRINVRPVDW